MFTPEDDLELLQRALKVAAIDAYKTEVADNNLDSDLIGLGKPFESVKDWVDDRIEQWLEEAEIESGL